MFAQTFNELTFTLELVPLGPLLLKAGEEPTPAREIEAALALSPEEQMVYFQEHKKREQGRREELKKQARERRERERRARQAARERGRTHTPVEEPEPADMRFVLTRRNGRDEPYIPGSSLKGVLRSHAERLARSMTVAGDAACNIVAQPGDPDPPCWHELGEPDAPRRQQVPAHQIYPKLCAACKLFGSPYLAGRLGISDAYLVNPPGDGPLPRRDGVGIDRRRGDAAEGAKYEYEFWDGGAFQAQVRVRNFELWQLGWLAHLLHGWQAGEIPVGFGTRRGLGRVSGQIRDLRVVYCGRLALEHRGPDLPLLGLGQFVEDEPALERYSVLTDESPSTLTDGVRLLTPDGAVLRRVWAVVEPDVLWQVVGPLWNPELLERLAERRQAANESLSEEPRPPVDEAG